MLPWIATTLFLVVLTGLVPPGPADALRLFAIGYGALTLFVVAPVWALTRLALRVSRRSPAPARVVVC